MPEALGGALASPPAVTAWDDEPMEVFAIFDDGALWDRYWDGTTWHPWESLGGDLEPGSTPAATLGRTGPARRPGPRTGRADMAALVDGLGVGPLAARDGLISRRLRPPA